MCSYRLGICNGIVMPRVGEARGKFTSADKSELSTQATFLAEQEWVRIYASSDACAGFIYASSHAYACFAQHACAQ